jgi:hypothetical protein
MASALPCATENVPIVSRKTKIAFILFSVIIFCLI